MMDDKQLSARVTLVACYTLSVILLSMVFVFLMGFFNESIDNDQLFAIVGPAFQTIVGGFIGLITGIKIGLNK
ncbi:hypothetical protein UFOVP1295_5 [uncultured Caudovirales phage]|uniref:Uncharacterized protein n=1 Tax=uncultured Caudovirales phage TaxID=2100421 RepID=A0A6J5RM03_9CAUD|nr:hypothetical protein UFOVP1295_5 [uncultured Caudovirales phage]